MIKTDHYTEYTMGTDGKCTASVECLQVKGTWEELEKLHKKLCEFLAKGEPDQNSFDLEDYKLVFKVS